MGFAPGDEVHVATFGKGVVREVRNGGRYLVEVKGRAFAAVESQLTAVAAGRKRKRVEPVTPPPEPPARSHVPASIDLHGMTVDEAVAAVDEFLNDGIVAGHAELRIVHGKGTGKVKAAVHARLRSLTVVRAFRLDPHNPGVTLVTL